MQSVVHYVHMAASIFDRLDYRMNIAQTRLW